MATSGVRLVAVGEAGSVRGLWNAGLGGIAALLAVVALVAGCGSDDGPAATGGDLGERVFSQNCATCHGSTGDGGTGPKLADGAVVELYPDPEDQRAIIVNGRNNMPAWGNTLSEEEIDAVVRYTREEL